MVFPVEPDIMGQSSNGQKCSLTSSHDITAKLSAQVNKDDPSHFNLQHIELLAPTVPNTKLLATKKHQIESGCCIFKICCFPGANFRPRT